MAAQSARSVRNHEIVDARNGVQQEICAAVVRNRNLVDRMLNKVIQYGNRTTPTPTATKHRKKNARAEHSPDGASECDHRERLGKPPKARVRRIEPCRKSM